MNDKDRDTSGDVALPQQALAERVREDYLELAASIGQKPAETWRRKTCRACGKEGLVQVLDLGEMPPANSLLKPEQVNLPEARFPLKLMLCEACGMVQLAHVVPAPLLFRSYLFFTSSSLAMSEHFSHLMAQAADEFVKPGGLVLEIGSNDGTALSSIRRKDVRVLGVDPARNVAVMAAARGVPTVSEFFTQPLAREIARVAGPAQLVVACNVLGHIDDLDDLLAGVTTVLAGDGAVVIEVPYLGDMIRRSEYDTIYHEHLSYFAVRPLVGLFGRYGLRIERVKFFAVHGGTIRVTAVRGNGCSAETQGWIDEEKKLAMATRGGIRAIRQKDGDRAGGTAGKIGRVQTARAEGDGVWSSPAKGTVILNYCGIDQEMLPAVIDSTPAKQGWHVPGTHQKILPPSAMETEKPDVLLLLAWNHAGEIMKREEAFVARGGVFIFPHLEG